MNKSTLSELFSADDKERLEQKSKNILVDMHNLLYRCLFSAVFQNPEDNEKFYFFKHLFMNSLFNVIKKFEPERVILAFDSTGSWRHQHYDGYKSTRKGARDSAVVDFDKFFPIFDEFKKELKETFTTLHIIDYPHAEADDIIAVLCKQKFKTFENIIVSNDKDFYQLLREPNNKLFDPRKNSIVNCINPKRELELKIVMGDKSDTIPAIKPRTGRATAEGILRKGLEDFLKENKEAKANYIRNKILIDFNFIPKEISTGIINTYCENQICDMESSKIMKFFSNHRLRKLMEDWPVFSPLIKNLK